MIYSLLRTAAAVALRWYYADVTIVGSERVPLTGPLIVAVNHPNALVDVLVAGRAVPRRLRFTAKATLFSNPAAARILGWLGVVPLRRATDEAGASSGDPSRNAQVFDAIAASLAQGRAILIFPEGKSHDEPAMAPLRTGAARMAVHARTTFGVTGTRVLPVGLIFERKDRPRTRAMAIVGAPIDVDPLIATNPDAVRDLTATIDARLRELTLNYRTIDEALGDARVSRVLAALVRFEAPSVGEPGDLRSRTEIAQLLPRLRAELLSDTSPHRQRARELDASLAALDERLREHRIALDDLTISRGVGPGAMFVVREATMVLLAGPVAMWGSINHFLPFRAALGAGGRVRHSAADPAMRTIVAGAAFVLMMYMVQGAAVTLMFGPWWGLGYVASLPVAADINLRMRERLHRALRRARTYLFFRARPALHEQLVREAAELRAEALALFDASGAAPRA